VVPKPIGERANQRIAARESKKIEQQGGYQFAQQNVGGPGSLQRRQPSWAEEASMIDACI
jgi:hypothetical protein